MRLPVGHRASRSRFVRGCSRILRSARRGNGLIAVIGFLYITRGTSVKHVRGLGADGAPVSPEEPEFPLSVGLLTGTLLTDGNKAEITLNDEVTRMVLDPAFGAQMDAIFADDLRYSTEIDAAAFSRRSWTEHLAEWGASLITRLL